MAIKVIPASEILQTPNVNILNDNVIKDVNYSYNNINGYHTTIEDDKLSTGMYFIGSSFNNEKYKVHTITEDIKYDGSTFAANRTIITDYNSRKDIVIPFEFSLSVPNPLPAIEMNVVVSNSYSFQEENQATRTFGWSAVQNSTEAAYSYGNKIQHFNSSLSYDELLNTIETIAPTNTNNSGFIQFTEIGTTTKGYLILPIYEPIISGTSVMMSAQYSIYFRYIVNKSDITNIDNNSQVDLQANELIQNGTKIGDTQISQYIANNIKQYYKNGKATIGLVCNYKGDNEYKVGDLVIPMKSNTEPILLDEEGNGKVFEVTSNEITYDGFGKQSLELVEFKIKKFNPTSWQYKRLPETQKFKFATGVGSVVYLTKTQMESSSGTDYALYKLNNFETEEGVLTWKQITPQEVTTATNNKIEIVGLEHFEQNILIAVKQSYTTDIGNEYQFKIYNYNTTTESLTSFYSNFFSISSDVTIDTSINGILLQVFRVASNVLFLQYRYQDGNTKSYTYLYFNNLDTTPTQTFNANIRSNRVIYAKDGFVYPLSTNNIINTSIGSLTERNNISCGIRNGTNSPLYIIYSQDLDKYVIGYSTFEQSDTNLVKYIEKLAIGDLGTNMQTKSITKVNCNNNYDNNIYMGVFEKNFVLIGSTLKNVYSSKDFDTITETQTTQETTDAQPIWLGEVGDAIVCVGASYDNNGNVIGNSIIISEKEV